MKRFTRNEAITAAKMAYDLQLVIDDAIAKSSKSEWPFFMDWSEIGDIVNYYTRFQPALNKYTIVSLAIAIVNKGMSVSKIDLEIVGSSICEMFCNCKYDANSGEYTYTIRHEKNVDFETFCDFHSNDYLFTLMPH